MLLAGEALFLRRGDDLAVDNQRGGAVVVEGGDAKIRALRLLEHGVDERRDSVPFARTSNPPKTTA